MTKLVLLFTLLSLNSFAKDLAGNDCISCGVNPEPTIFVSKVALSGSMDKLLKHVERKPADADIPPETEIPLCSSLSQGLIDSAQADLERLNKDYTLINSYGKINCTKNKKDYSPGTDPIRHMLSVKYLGSTFNPIITMIVRFEKAGKKAGEYFSNVIDCKKLIMKRCGRDCYTYNESRTLWEEMDYWQEKYPDNDELEQKLDEIRRQMTIHQKRFPVKFDQDKCPAYLTKRVESTGSKLAKKE